MKRQIIYTMWYGGLCGIIFVLMLLVTMNSCVLTQNITKDFSIEEKRIYTTMKTLEAAKEFRNLGLSAAGEYYKAGLMADKTKEDIIKIGNQVQSAINYTAEALKLYMILNDKDNLIDLQQKILVYQQIYGEFVDIIMPYMIRQIK